MFSAWTVWAALLSVGVLLWAQRPPGRRAWAEIDVTLARTRRGLLVQRVGGLFFALVATGLLIAAGGVLNANPRFATVLAALGGAAVGFRDIMRLSWASDNCLTWSNGVVIQSIDARFRVCIRAIGAWDVGDLVLERVRTSVSSPTLMTWEGGITAVDGPLIEERVFVVLGAPPVGEPFRIQLAFERFARSSAANLESGSRRNFEQEVSQLLGATFVDVKTRDGAAAMVPSQTPGRVISRRGKYGFLSTVPAGPFLALVCGAPCWILAAGLGVMFGLLPGEIAVAGFTVLQASVRRYVTFAAKRNFAGAMQLANFVSSNAASANLPLNLA